MDLTSLLSRYTAEMIYGSSLGAFAQESQEHKRLRRELKNKKRTPEMVEEVRIENQEGTLTKCLWFRWAVRKYGTPWSGSCGGICLTLSHWQDTSSRSTTSTGY